METWTITFGECVENHAGMQKIGDIDKCGFTYNELVHAQNEFIADGLNATIYDLTDKLEEKYQKLLDKDELSSACILVVKNGIKYFNAFPRKLIKEVKDTRDIVDKKAYMRGRVVNKHARWNLCYADESQEPDFENGKGTIVNFSDVPYLSAVREKLPDLIPDSADNLFAELNYYYDIRTTYIGFHGDSERKKVIGIRFGAQFPLHYQWFYNGNSIGNRITFNLDGGDVYIMGAKAVGNDWKRKLVPTLRHAAGFDDNI
jgi:hypothetical protein